MERKTMTRYQYNIYKAIKDYVEEYDRGPTLRELCKLTGNKSMGTIQVHVRHLKELGYIDYEKNKTRTMHITKDFKPYDE